MKITKRQLRRIIKEEKAKLRESVADMQQHEHAADEAGSKLADLFYDSMMTLFTEDPSMFDGRSSKQEWEEQVTYATQELETSISHAIAQVIEEVEMKLHDGEYHTGNGPFG